MRCGALSIHFLDVVRGLPTLRAFNRARRAGRGCRRGQRALSPRRRWRRSGSASSPGSVLELAATLGVALVAVTAGRAPRRRQPGASGRADRARPRARAVPAVPPARRRVPRERGRPGGRGADVRAARRPGGAAAPPADRGPRRARRRPPSGSRTCRSPIRLAPGSVLDGFDLELAAGRGRRVGRRERRWQEHGRRAAARPARSRRADGSPSAASTWRRATSTRGGGSSRGCRSSRACSAARSRRTSGSVTRHAPDRRVREAAASGRRARIHRRAARWLRHADRRGRTHSSRRASAGGSVWPGRSSGTPRS